MKAVDVAVFPCVLNILPNSVFNQKDPIIMGVEVMDGILKVGTPLIIPKNGFLKVGKVVSIEMNNVKADRVRKGAQCAISVVNEGNPQMTYGRQFNGDHALYSEVIVLSACNIYIHQFFFHTFILLPIFIHSCLEVLSTLLRNISKMR